MPFADGRLFLALIPIAAFSLRRHNLWTLVLLSFLGFGLGWWRGGTVAGHTAGDQVLYGRKIIVTGQAADDAVYGKHYQLEFVLSNVRVAAPLERSFTGSLAIGGFGEAAVYRGDIVRVEGKLYPARGNNVGRISYGGLRVVRRDASALNDFRRHFAAGLESALPEPVASFALGILIGQRSTLPDDISGQLQHVGLTHIIAVSGANLTIIILACRRLLAKLSKYQNTMICLMLIAVFLAITGLSPPIVRAGVISTLGLWAWYYGRQLRPVVLLLAGGAITVVANPAYLWGNVSWYLSYLSFFGILMLAPTVTKRFWGTKEPKILTSVLIETVCATVMVTPYALYVFGQLSTISLLANVLVVPFIPVAMLLSVVAGMAGMVIPALAGWVSWPATTVMTYMLDVASLLERLPHSYLENIGFSLTAMLVCYATILVVLSVMRRPVRARTPAAINLKSGNRHAYDPPQPPPES